MKYIYILTLILFTSCSNGQDRTGIRPEELKEKLQTGKDYVLLDVRTQEEYNEGRIKGSQNIDFYADDFKQQIGGLDKDKTYYVYCRSGNRSSKAVEIMKELQFKNVYNVEGGIMGWQEKGMPVEQ